MNIVEISRFERIKKKKKIFVATFSSSSNRRVVVHPDNCTNRLSVPPSVHERRGGERKGKEGVCVCKRCPSVRKSHWPFREITWTAKLPRNIATPRVIGEWKREARRGERKINEQLHDVSIFQLFYESFFFFFFFSLSSLIHPVCWLDTLLSLHVE